LEAEQRLPIIRFCVQRGADGIEIDERLGRTFVSRSATCYVVESGSLAVTCLSIQLLSASRTTGSHACSRHAFSKRRSKQILTHRAQIEAEEERRSSSSSDNTLRRGLRQEVLGGKPQYWRLRSCPSSGKLRVESLLHVIKHGNSSTDQKNLGRKENSARYSIEQELEI